MRRFYTEARIAIGQLNVISGSNARHIDKVLRLKPGEIITIFDGQGGDYEAKIVATSTNRVEVSVIRRIPSPSAPDVDITLAQAMLKGKKMDMLVRQITELGITRWLPFKCERSVPVPNRKRIQSRIERWETIVKEALKQCKRGLPTEICSVVPFEEMLTMGKASDVKLIFWENETRSLQDGLVNMPAGGETIFAILGPEGGFSETEIRRAASLGYLSVSLGPRVLKSETAALTVSVLMQYIFGDLGGNPGREDR
jgi:16S rRNA (uracil1498-N3)-methyltransferase